MNAILLENADYQAKIKEKLIAIEKSVKESEKNQPVSFDLFRKSLKPG